MWLLQPGMLSRAAIDGVSGGGGGAALATLDGTPEQTTLSNGNLTATLVNPFNACGARSATVKATGKYYYEGTMTTTHGAGDSVAILTSTGTYADIHNAQNCLMVIKSGIIFANNSNSGKSLGSIVAGDVVAIAVDLTARKAWMRKNGNDWNGDASADPAAGTNGITLPATVSFGPAVEFTGSGTTAGDRIDVNFGQTAYAFSVPSGYGNWTA